MSLVIVHKAKTFIRKHKNAMDNHSSPGKSMQFGCKQQYSKALNVGKQKKYKQTELRGGL